MKIIHFSNELAKETTSVAGAYRAFEKKMNEQMSKGSVVFDSALENNSVTDTNNTIVTSTETSIQKSPPARVNNA